MIYKLAVLAMTGSALGQVQLDPTALHSGESGADTVTAQDTNGTSPPPPPPELWGLDSWFRGSCDIVKEGRCVTDGVGKHGSQERCTIKASFDLIASATQYDIEEGWDYLTINNVKYPHASSPPDKVLLRQGDVVTWTSDGSINRQGFTLCAHRTHIDAPPPNPPAAEISPPPASPASPPVRPPPYPPVPTEVIGPDGEAIVQEPSYITIPPSTPPMPTHESSRHMKAAVHEEASARKVQHSATLQPH